MRTRYSAWLNGHALHEIDESIYITDIKEAVPKQQAVTSARPGGRGTRLIRMDRQSLSVVIRFAVRERDTERRRSIAERIRAWACGGYLEVSDRPGLRLHVVCEKLPNIGSALKWTQEEEMTFTAYDVPWWENIFPSRAVYTGSNGTAVLASTGTADSLLEASILAQDAVSSMTISLNGQSMTFTDLGLSAGDRLTISHDPVGILSVLKGDTSMLNKRTAQSADELWVKPGSNSVSFAADGNCKATFTTRGRRL